MFEEIDFPKMDLLGKSIQKEGTGLGRGGIKVGSKIPVPNMKRFARVTKVLDGMTLGLPDRIEAELGRAFLIYDKISGRRFRVMRDSKQGMKTLGTITL